MSKKKFLIIMLAMTMLFLAGCSTSQPKVVIGNIEKVDTIKNRLDNTIEIKSGNNTISLIANSQMLKAFEHSIASKVKVQYDYDFNIIEMELAL